MRASAGLALLAGAASTAPATAAPTRRAVTVLFSPANVVGSNGVILTATTQPGARYSGSIHVQIQGTMVPLVVPLVMRTVRAGGAARTAISTAPAP